ncbi:hypothetical protein ACGFOU_13190 [Streptomyces sp. NPDC048595]
MRPERTGVRARAPVYREITGARGISGAARTPRTVTTREEPHTMR